MHSYDRFYIGGQSVTPAGSDTIDVISPHTEEVVGRVPDGTAADMDRAVAAARDAFDNGPWPRTDPVERARRWQGWPRSTPTTDEMAELISQEMGAPITYSRRVAELPLGFLSYFAELGRGYRGEEQPGMFGPVTVRREPVGVVAAIVPWNVPQFLTLTKLAPALVAGCTVVVKPAPETPLDAYLLAEVIQQAGSLPPA